MEKRMNKKKENKYVNKKKNYTNFNFAVFVSPAVERKFYYHEFIADTWRRC